LRNRNSDEKFNPIKPRARKNSLLYVPSNGCFDGVAAIREEVYMLWNCVVVEGKIYEGERCC
jgi:hypothetical protein